MCPNLLLFFGGGGEKLHRHSDFIPERPANLGGDGPRNMRHSLEKSLKRLENTDVDVSYEKYSEYMMSNEEVMHGLTMSLAEAEEDEIRGVVHSRQDSRIAS